MTIKFEIMILYKLFRLFICKLFKSLTIILFLVTYRKFILIPFGNNNNK